MKSVNQAEADRRAYEDAYDKTPVVGNGAGAKAMQMTDPVAARMVGESELNYLSRRAAAVQQAKADSRAAKRGVGPRDKDGGDQDIDALTEGQPEFIKPLRRLVGVDNKYHARQEMNKLKSSGGPR